VTRIYPDDMNDALRFILGIPNFQCASMASALRADGQDIPRKAEAEQAAVLHWLIKAALDRPNDWKDWAIGELGRIAKANEEARK
jgi:hypothetical protein